MPVHNVRIELEEIYDDIYTITERKKLLGYMTKSNNSELPFAVVLTDGKDLGEYDCLNCVVKAIFMHVNNITDGSRVISGGRKKMAMLNVMEMLEEIFPDIFKEKEVTGDNTVINEVSDTPKILH